MREFEFKLDFGYHDYPPSLKENDKSDGEINENFTEKNISILTKNLYSDDSFSGGWCAIGIYLLTAGANVGIGLISAWLYDKIKKKNATAIYLNQFYIHLGEKKIKNLNTGVVSELVNEKALIKKLIEENVLRNSPNQCNGLNKNGKRCKRKIIGSKFCFYHKPNHNQKLKNSL